MYTLRISKRLAGLVFACLAVLFLMGDSCYEDPSIAKDRQVTSNQMQTYQRTQPVPVFDWSQSRDELIQIYLLTNSARNTYTVFASNGTGDVRFVCPSIGFPIPADTQLTNPHQGVRIDSSSGVVAVEQAEPNGLYTSSHTDGTWALCYRANGDLVPVYSELKLTAFPFAVRVNAKGQIEEVEDSPSTAKVTVDTKRAQATADRVRQTMTATKP